MKLLGLIRFITLVLLVTGYSIAAAAAAECKTAKGQKCVCASNHPKKCAHIAKAVCLGGKTVETPAGQLLTVHENNIALFKQCRDNGGMKEVVSNIPLIDNFHNPTQPKQNTAAAGN